MNKVNNKRKSTRTACEVIFFEVQNKHIFMMDGRDFVDLQISEHQRKIRIVTIMKILQSWFFFSEDQSNIGKKGRL